MKISHIKGNKTFCLKSRPSKSLLSVMALWILVTNIAAVPVGSELVLEGTFNARSSRFYKGQENIQTQLMAGTRVKVARNHLMNSGNHGLLVEVLSGANQGKTTWIYYDKSNPRMKVEDSSASQSEAVAPQPQQTARMTASVSGFQSMEDLTRSLANLRENQPVTRAAEPATKASSAGEAVTEAQGECTDCKTQNPLSDVMSQLGRSNPAVGARLAMAEIYQSCDVLKLPDYEVRGEQANKLSSNIKGSFYDRKITGSVASIVAAHAYLQNTKTSNQCFPVKQKPPVFIYGGRPSYDASKNELNLLTSGKGKMSAVTGLDCSGFVSAAFSISGLKFKPTTTSVGGNMVTTSDLMAMNENNSCFQRPKVKKDQPFDVGDLMVFHGHVVVIDKMGSDPLGFQKMKQAGRFPTDVNQCKYLEFEPQNFNFSVIHSTGYKDIGASRMQAKDFFTRPRTNKGEHRFAQASYALRNVMIQACLSDFGVERKFDKDIYANLSGRGPLLSSQLLRHKGPSAANCTFPENKRPKLKHQSCTGDCLSEALQ